ADAWTGSAIPTSSGGGSLATVADLVPRDDGTLDLDLLASSLHADDRDVRLLLRVLVGRLSGALGDRLEVERTGRFRKSDEIRRVSIQLGDEQLEATVERGSLTCTIAKSSGGIRIRSTKVTIEEWIRQLLTVLRDESTTSQATRLALESIVIGEAP
ncbi:MAG: hypothetical protein ACRDYZ_09490, partial [Acidimicrobiales bacterium]